MSNTARKTAPTLAVCPRCSGAGSFCGVCRATQCDLGATHPEDTADVLCGTCSGAGEVDDLVAKVELRRAAQLAAVPAPAAGAVEDLDVAF